jgi:GT2 family glycosyltransferase
LAQVSIIIVNYNVRYFLEQCLVAVRKASEQLDVEVWVVDNNSVDGSVAMVQEKFPEVKLIANTDNPGFSKANNQAIRLCHAPYVLLLNPDTVIQEDTLRVCTQWMDTYPDAGALGVRMIDGAGKFLPESKRGFPSPWAAICKMLGLSRLFNKSPLFNQYHLGFLEEHSNHEVDILSGAFMFLRKSALDQAGLLDEQFFMYGEDIDLSYRITQSGYKNYYLADTTIIHYKGESTKKSSVNYVRVFYQAMILFARKHFTGTAGKSYIALLQAGIWLRAGLQVLVNFLKSIATPVVDALVIATVLHWVKHLWAVYHFQDANYYPSSFYWVNMPLYTVLWLVFIYYSGGYDRPYKLGKLWRGMLTGTLFLAAVYGFLNLEYRSSRAILLLGTGAILLLLSLLRILLHYWRHGHFRIHANAVTRLLIVGEPEESDRARQLLLQASVPKHYLGRVALAPVPPADALGGLHQLSEIVRIYKADEIIFCAKDVPAKSIMASMSALGARIQYKILPEGSLSIIGSSDRDSTGEWYTLEIRFNLANPVQQRNKRVLDLFLCLAFLPLVIFTFRRFSDWWNVLLGKKTWLAYGLQADTHLPPLKPGVFQLSHTWKEAPEPATLERQAIWYARDYQTTLDLSLIWACLRKW